MSSTPEPPSPPSYPARLTGELDPTVSRGLWIVKWFLAIPHVIILLGLGIAAAVVTIIAWFAILFTGRYPRGMFDFTVGVMRWGWRVAFYAYSALGTDKYPPFTLKSTAYPADFTVEYPEHLSRGLVLVKSWLLAIPHYVVVGILVGGGVMTNGVGVHGAWVNGVWMYGSGTYRGQQTSGTGISLLEALVIIAAVILLFAGRYPRGIFDLVMGINRWSYRVAVYALLLRDEYPPFRLDMGGADAGGGYAPAPHPPVEPPLAP